MHVLIKAHEISPIRGSECSNGWNIVDGLSNHVKLTVVHAETNQYGTINYKKEINTIRNKNNINYIAIKQPFLTVLLSKLNLFLSGNNQGSGISFLYFIGVFFWERKVYRLLKQMDLSQIDIIHNLNHVSFREPSFLWKLNKPFVWGPTSGIGNIPFSFAKSFPFKFRFINFLRSSSNYLQSNFSSRIINASKHASKIFYVSKEDEMYLKRFNNNLQYLPDVTIQDLNQHDKLFNVCLNKVKLIWVGRIDQIKSLDILLEVFKTNQYLKKYYDIVIIGDGILKNKLTDYAIENNIDNVIWLGKVSRDIVKSEMFKSDIFIHTSIKEASATVIMEALSSGLPVICHDAFGMSKVIDDNIGFKIPYSSKPESVKFLTEILIEIKKNPLIIVEKAKNINSYANRFTTKNIIKQFISTYENIISSL